MHFLKKLGIGFALMFALTPSANATLDGCAVVLKTPDGFLNMRNEPSMKSPVLAKLHRGDRVIYDVGREVREWTRVWIDERVGWGWVASRFLQSFDCQ
jgi:hypothetical protein